MGKNVLTDEAPMRFGKHKGTPMLKVPAHYLHWLWNSSLYSDVGDPLHEYIKENMNALQKEHPDGFWKEVPKELQRGCK